MTFPQGHMTVHNQWHVELYTVIMSVFFLLLVTISGTVLNIAFLLCMKYVKKMCRLQYGFLINLAATNLILSVLWCPLEMATVISNYDGVALPTAICWLTICLYRLCMAVIFVTILALVAHRLCGLVRGKQNGCLREIPSIILGLVVAWVCGIGFTVISGLGMHVTAEDSMCQQFPPLSEENRLLGARVSVIATVFYLVVLTVVLIALVTVMKVKHQKKLNLDDSNMSEIPLRHSETENCSSTSRDATPSGGCDVANLDGKASGSQTTRKNSTAPLIQIQVKDTEKNSDSEDELDEVDLLGIPPRIKFAQLSARRHTIADVGLADNPFAKGKFVPNNVGKKKGDKKGYNYVRKWSVDVSALQDQLMNPKLHVGNHPFSDLALDKLKDRESKPLASPIPNANKNAKPAEKKEEEKKKDEDKMVSFAEKKDNDNNHEDISKTENGKTEKKEPVKPKETVVGFADQDIEIQSKVESENNSEKPGTEKSKETVVAVNEQMTELELHPEQQPLTTPGLTGDNEPNGPPGSESLERKSSLQLRRTSLKSLKACAGLVLLFLVSTLPYAICHCMQALVSPGQHINLAICLLAASVIQLPLYPLIFALMEKKICQAMRRAQKELFKYKCVCYWNKGTPCYRGYEPGHTRYKAAA